MERERVESGPQVFPAPVQVAHFRGVKPAAYLCSATATLYFALTGKNVHDLPEDRGERIAYLVTAAPVPVNERCADVPPELAEVIRKALSREPGERYPDVGALRTEMNRFA